MKTNLLRAGALSCTLLASTALTTPAFCQGAPADPPPIRQGMDANGVSTTNGRLNRSLGTVSTGGAPDGTLTYQMQFFGPNMRDTATGWIQHVGTSYVVSFGSWADEFYAVASPTTFEYPNLSGSGARLYFIPGWNIFVYQRPDTSQATFDPALSGGYPEQDIVARVVSKTLPDGLTENYTYSSATVSIGGTPTTARRVQSITNNRGYQLALLYVNNSPTDQATLRDYVSVQRAIAINNAVDYCNPASPQSCTFTQSWPDMDFTYATSGTDTLVTATDSAGVATTVTRRSDGRITRIEQPGLNPIIVGYDSNNLVSSYDDGAGTWGYTYTLSGSKVATATIDPPLGGNVSVTNNLTAGRPASVTDGAGNTVSYQYDSVGRTTRVTMPEGNYLSFTYDVRGNLTESRQVAKAGSGLADIVTSASFPANCSTSGITLYNCNLPLTSTDARGNVTDYSWSGTHGGLLSVTRPAPTTGGTRPQARFTYAQQYARYRNSSGTIVNAPTPVWRLTRTESCATGSSCDGTAAETEAVFDYGAGTAAATNLLPVQLTSQAGDASVVATTTNTFDPFGNLLTQDGPLTGTADTVRFRYDAARQLIGAVGPDPDGAGPLKHRAGRISRDTNGLVTRVETGTVDSQSDADWSAFSSLEEVQREYDANARPVVRRVVSGSTTYQLTQRSYDSMSREHCVAQRMNPSEFATASLPADACTQDTQGSFGPDRITRTTYDNAGRPTKVETGVGVAGVTADEATVTYTDNGRVRTVADANGNTTYMNYDGFDRQNYRVMPHPTSTGSWNWSDYDYFEYDAAGNMTVTYRRDGSRIGYSYDNLNRLSAVDTPPAGTGAGSYGEYDRSYAYDNLSRPTSIASASGHSIALGYDALGRQVSETSYYGAKTMAYDLAGRLTRLSWPDGLYIDYDHLVTGEVSAIRENGATSGAGVLATYSHDDRGRRTQVSRGNGSSTGYAYDNVSRLTQLVQNLNGTGSDLTLDFTLNPAGEIASNTRSNDAYSYTGHANTNVANTVNGLNQVTGTGGTSVSHDARGNISWIGSDWYSYTSENFLREATSALILPNPRLRPLQVYNTSTGGYVRFDYLGDQLIAEYDSSNALLRRYVPGPGIDEPLVWYEGSGTSTRRSFHADERGSVVAVSDGSGNLVGSNPNRYDEYGAPQGTLTGRFGYTGQAWLPETGMYDYRARAYNPALGRFMQTDPIGYDGGMNLYAYVGNNPVNATDPSGSFPFTGPFNNVVVLGPAMFPTASALWAALPQTFASGWFGTFNWAGIINRDGPSEAEMEAGEQDILVEAQRRHTDKDSGVKAFEQGLLGDVMNAVRRWYLPWRIMVGQGPDSQRQIDLSDALEEMTRRSTRTSSHGARYEYRTRGNARDDYHALARACGCQITTYSNGTMRFDFMGRTFDFLPSSGGIGAIIEHYLDNSLMSRFSY